MDPFTALAAASAASTVLVNLSQSIIDIMDLCEQIKSADVTLMMLLSQLNTMKAALEQIDKLSYTVQHDFQFRMDLDIACHSCLLQMRVLDAQIAKIKLRKYKVNELKLLSRIRVVTSSKGMEACISRLDRQTNALNLLITVLTSRTVLEQRQLLGKDQTRELFKKVRDDASTITIDEDDVSFRTAAIPDPKRSLSSRLSQKFKPDRETKQNKGPNKPMRSIFRRNTDKTVALAEVYEVPEGDDDDDNDDGSSESGSDTLVGEPRSIEVARPFSRMLAISCGGSDVEKLLERARNLWATPRANEDITPLRRSDSDSFILNTRFFDINLHLIDLTTVPRFDEEEHLLKHQDASAVLFAVKPAEYIDSPASFSRDLNAFERAVNNYNLCLAKVILYVDTSGLGSDDDDDRALAESMAADTQSRDPASAVDGIVPSSSIERLESRFLQGVKMGSGAQRVHCVVGKPSAHTAGRIFANVAHAGQVKAARWRGWR